MTGSLKIFAALASPITLLKSNCRSMDMTPKVICGWWSMKMTVQFCGVSRPWTRFAGVGESAIAVSFAVCGWMPRSMTIVGRSEGAGDLEMGGGGPLPFDRD